MEVKDGFLSSAVFNFFMMREGIVGESFGPYQISHDDNTCLVHERYDNGELVVYGLAVDTLNGSLVNGFPCESIDELLSKEVDWGGRYCIFLRAHNDMYILGDASGSIPVFYSFLDGNLVCGTNQFEIARRCGYSINPELLAIRKGSSLEQAMPGDVTLFKEVKRLLPNHYLDVNRQEVVRFCNWTSEERRSLDDVISLTIERSQLLAQAYASQYSLACPLTGGKDSRLVLGLLYGSGLKVPCYTMKHVWHKGDEGDLSIPPKLASTLGFDYCLISDVAHSDRQCQLFDGIYEEGLWPKVTLSLAETIQSRFKGYAIISGDICDQVGKCGLHQDIPEHFASPSYFQTKIHNTDNMCRRYLQKWMDDVCSSAEKVSIMDLFAVESRVGRWANETNMIYCNLGLVSLNIFNSRRIIYTWASLSRNERKKAVIHHGILERVCPQLLDFPYDRTGLIGQVAKSSWPLFFLASTMKSAVSRVKKLLHR